MKRQKANDQRVGRKGIEEDSESMFVIVVMSKSDGYESESSSTSMLRNLQNFKSCAVRIHHRK